MSTVCPDIQDTTAGCCADCGHIVTRRTAYHDEGRQAIREICIRCLVLAYQRRQFEAGCCG